MRVGIIGSGTVGKALAAGFAVKGHDVVMGARNPGAKLADTKPGQYGEPSFADWAKANAKVKVQTMADAARHGEVLVFAIKGADVEQAVKAAGPDNMANKLVLDTSNPLDFTPNGLHKSKNIPDSCMQVAQRAAPKAKFVKAWNCTPGGQMVDPKQGGDQLICGDDKVAKEQAAKILREFGWGVADCGTADKAPYVEATAIAVCNYAAAVNDWGWTVKLPGRK